MFTNLLSNALKYGANKPVDVRVAVRDGNAFVEVRDRGIGIDPAFQAQLFEPFERVVHRGYPGLGLGLYIVRTLVQAHGGKVVLESAPGRGSMFRVELPIAGPSEERQRSAA